MMVYRYKCLLIVILLSLTNAVVIDAMFLFPIGWLSSVIVPAAVERVSDLITKVHRLIGFNLPDNIEIAESLDGSETYGTIACILSVLYFLGYICMMFDI
jgi:hypothetical protein